MIPPKYNATKDLFQALIEAKRDFGRTGEDAEVSPPTLRSASDDDGSEAHEALFQEHE